MRVDRTVCALPVRRGQLRRSGSSISVIAGPHNHRNRSKGRVNDTRCFHRGSLTRVLGAGDLPTGAKARQSSLLPSGCSRTTRPARGFLGPQSIDPLRLPSTPRRSPAEYQPNSSRIDASPDPQITPLRVTTLSTGVVSGVIGPLLRPEGEDLKQWPRLRTASGRPFGSRAS